MQLPLSIGISKVRFDGMLSMSIVTPWLVRKTVVLSRKICDAVEFVLCCRRNRELLHESFRHWAHQDLKPIT